MSYLVLVRHGDSFWNKEGYNCFTGWVDIANLPSGIEKLIKAGKLLSNFKFDIAFTSELYRGIETVMLILSYNKVSGTPIILHKGDKTAKWSKFYHRDFGKFVPVIRAWQLNERYYGKFGAEQVFIWRRSYDVAPPGGESLKETRKRVVRFFKKKILPELKKGKNVLIGAHGNSLRALVSYLDGLKPDEIPKLEIKKGVPLVYEYKHKILKKIGYLKKPFY